MDIEGNTPPSDEEIEEIIESHPIEKLHIGELVVTADTPEVELVHTGYIDFKNNEHNYTGTKQALGELIQDIASLWDEKGISKIDMPRAQYRIDEYVEEFISEKEKLFNREGIITLIYKQTENTDHVSPLDGLKEDMDTYSRLEETLKLARYIKWCGGFENISHNELVKGVEQYNELLPIGNTNTVTYDPESKTLEKDIKNLFSDDFYTI